MVARNIRQRKFWGKPNAIVAYEDLTSDKLNENLENQKKYKNLRGIRQILNYSETDPELNVYDGVDRNFLTDGKWRNGFSLLSKYNLSFDLQVWPSQLLKSYELSKDFP